MPERSPARPKRSLRRPSLASLLAIALIVLAALALRVDGIGARTLSHPENFAPGLDVPDWVRFPPPRHDLESVLRGTLIDGHPPTYFVALLGWTKVFGSSLTSLRMPSALLGTLAVALVFLVARRETSDRVALLAAALLALHGHHLYWSQLARMYVPTATLALLSTWFMLRLRERGRSGDLWGFFATTVLALATQLYAWPIVFAQFIGGLLLDVRERRAPTVARAQILAVVASLWVVQLSIYQNPPTRWHGSASEYWQLGYLFHTAVPFFEARPGFAFDGPLLLVLGLALLALASLAPRKPALALEAPGPEVPALPRWLEAAVVAGSTALLLAFAAFAPARSRIDWTPIWAASAGPALLAGTWLLIERRVSDLARRPPAWLARVAALEVPLSVQLAVVPAVLMMLVSLARGVMVARGTVVFLPFFSIAAALGVAALFRIRAVGIAALLLVVGLHLASVRYFRAAESTPRDYAGLARLLLAEVQPEDVILVRNNYTYPPLLYYLHDVHAQCVPDDRPERLAKTPDARMWVFEFATDGPREALPSWIQDRRATRVLKAPGAQAVLYESQSQ